MGFCLGLGGWGDGLGLGGLGKSADRMGRDGGGGFWFARVGLVKGFFFLSGSSFFSVLIFFSIPKTNVSAVEDG